ncbi:VWA domain-containing protein [Candidatus Uabimicrobium sp. HlEnr_7]|uniref:vWA domain-containing protein n=1 Tax=Candidatus Uabimicrobium helgolandensis TaxID=3095367 RepID=UPI00355651CF
MSEKDKPTKGKFWDQKSLRCMGISTVAHIFFLIAIYIAMMPASGSEGEDIIEVSFESAPSQSTENSEDTPENYQPDLSENIEDIENDLDNIVEDGYDESEYIKEQYDKIRDKNTKANKEKQNIGNNLVKRSKYGPLTPRMFYGVRIFAKNIIFVLDVSGSMDIREARLQLKNAYHSLKSGESFNIILYSDKANQWQNSGQAATEENKQQADGWLNDAKSGGATNMYDGLRIAFKIARAHRDTIFFITDGHPTKGEIVDPKRILQTVDHWNQEKNITIHTIGLGSHQAEDFLESLAAQNNGNYYKR